jgi:hypothetical protein
LKLRSPLPKLRSPLTLLPPLPLPRLPLLLLPRLPLLLLPRLPPPLLPRLLPPLLPRPLPPLLPRLLPQLPLPLPLPPRRSKFSPAFGQEKASLRAGFFVSGAARPVQRSRHANPSF